MFLKLDSMRKNSQIIVELVLFLKIKHKNKQTIMYLSISK